MQVRAWRYDGTSDSLPQYNHSSHLFSFSSDYVNVKTLNGEVRAYIGDFIIENGIQDFSVCKPEYFLDTYEIV